MHSGKKNTINAAKMPNVALKLICANILGTKNGVV
jgi:hypothetical protein